jgi:hypothetical protein
LKVGETREFKVLSVSQDEKLYLTILDFELAKNIYAEISIDEKIEKVGIETNDNDKTKNS